MAATWVYKLNIQRYLSNSKQDRYPETRLHLASAILVVLVSEDTYGAQSKAKQANQSNII